MRDILDEIFLEVKYIYTKIDEIEAILNESISEKAMKLIFKIVNSHTVDEAEMLFNK